MQPLRKGSQFDDFRRKQKWLSIKATSAQLRWVKGSKASGQVNLLTWRNPKKSSTTGCPKERVSNDGWIMRSSLLLIGNLPGEGAHEICECHEVGERSSQTHAAGQRNYKPEGENALQINKSWQATEPNHAWKITKLKKASIAIQRSEVQAHQGKHKTRHKDIGQLCTHDA